MSRRGLVVLAVALLALGGCGLLGAWYAGALQPVATSGEPRIVHIPPGSGAARITQILASEGLIANGRAFGLMLALSGLGGKLQAGHYELSPTMSARAIAEKIASGDVATRRITIPEGLTLQQIAERVAEAGLAEREAFLAAAVPATVADGAEMPLPEGTLEGYLFPETYEFTYDDGAAAIVTRMVHELYERFVAPHREEIARRGLSLHQIITLASLVEREAQVERERALIAGVIQNRLDRGMRLQIDATVQYALGEHRPRLLYRDLQVDSPYNTYRHAGLPPGPIAAPGLPSLLAALRPAPTDALFYVARSDGTHVFTRTYEEHQRAIRAIRGQ
ncbi:MAG: endolytic transglycosylase MltG [Armatimonadota bacterium]